MHLISTTPCSTELLEKEQEVLQHPAWHGLLTGMECEQLLRGKQTFSYLIRQGEARFHYYLSYVLEAPFTYKHQPFTITQDDQKPTWTYQNGHVWHAPTVVELIPLIIHPAGQPCLPLIK